MFTFVEDKTIVIMSTAKKSKDLFEKILFTPDTDGYCFLTKSMAIKYTHIAIDNEIESVMWLNLLCPFSDYVKEHLKNKITELKEVKKEIDKL